MELELCSFTSDIKGFKQQMVKLKTIVQTNVGTEDLAAAGW